MLSTRRTTGAMALVFEMKLDLKDISHCRRDSEVISNSSGQMQRTSNQYIFPQQDKMLRVSFLIHGNLGASSWDDGIFMS